MVQNQKLQHRWSILCSNSSVDVQNNNLSLFNTIEQVNVGMELFADKKPIVLPMNLELVTLWEKVGDEKEAQGDIEVEFQDPEGNSLTKVPYAISVSKKRHRHFVKINGLPITKEPGRYIFKIRKKEGMEDKFIEVGEVPIEINIAYTLPKERQNKKVH